jgi:hypothetical protein
MTPCIGGGCRLKEAQYRTVLTPEPGQDRSAMRVMATGVASRLKEILGEETGVQANNPRGSSWEITAFADCAGGCVKQRLVNARFHSEDVTQCQGCAIYSR